MITDAMLMAGVAGAEQPLDASTTQLALRALNRMMDAWSSENLMVFSTIEDNFAMVPSQVSYSTSLLSKRPITIEYIFVRQNVGSSIDYKIELIDAQEYAELVIKNIASLPTKCYYDSDTPAGSLLFYPAPSTSYQAYVGYYDLLQTFADTTTVVALPPGYQRAIVQNLAITLCPPFGKQATPDLLRMASEAKAQLKRTNYRSPVMVSNTPLGTSIFNIYRGS